MNLISIPAFQDNYIWLLANRQKHCVIVDPGESAPVLATLAQGPICATSHIIDPSS